jgi:hypothetical protein
LWTRNLIKKNAVFTKGKLDKRGARLEHTPLKSLRHLAQETGISISSAAKATKLLKLWQYKATVIHALQPCDLANKINFCNFFLQSVHDSEVDPHLTFFF